MARKILLADDSVTAQNMGRRILSDAGYDVITVNNGSAALKKIAESKPDLIILDVYMPGYGGLEVCQRLKESQETGRIPVLLSVGKLEPFKVEESRRVRADGFIIKPFEASELLTALTKLEDKIVPEAVPVKGGRFAKANASAEQLSTDNQADPENSSWRTRLAIPSGTPKIEGPETQEPHPASAGLRDIAQREESRSVAMKSAEAAVAAALPQGITTEELAAIAAIANTLADKNEISGAKAAEPEVTDPARIEVPVEEKTESATTVAAEAATFASVSVVPNEVPNEVQNEAQSETRKGIQTPAQAAEMQRATTDAEVLAALASLSPMHTETAVAGESASTNEGHSHDREEVPVSVAASGGERIAEAGASGPRWIAQAVAIADDESTLILEREMEKAYAAMAALEADRASASVADEAVVASAEPVSSTPETSTAPAAESSQQIKAEEQASSLEVVAAVSVPEVSAPEAAVAPVVAENVTAIRETSPAVTNESAAYAAAASAGSGMSESGTLVESSSAAEVPSTVAESVMAVPTEVDPGRESELAAAWQNWRQIRESILGSQVSKDMARAASVESKEIPLEEPASVQAGAEASSESAPSESAAIANIVDSVLAELKPKLMEEITKKMKKDKKK